MSKNNLENLFLLLKSVGLFKEYEDYNDFKKKKYEQNDPLEDFKSKMTDQERKDFEFLFEDKQ